MLRTDLLQRPTQLYSDNVVAYLYKGKYNSNQIMIHWSPRAGRLCACKSPAVTQGYDEYDGDNQTKRMVHHSLFGFQALYICSAWHTALRKVNQAMPDENE